MEIVRDPTPNVIEFAHANLHRPVSIDVFQYFGCYRSADHQATFLMSTGSTIIPVKESVEEVNRAVWAARLEMHRAMQASKLPE